jgi:hypothetical protein
MPAVERIEQWYRPNLGSIARARTRLEPESVYTLAEIEGLDTKSGRPTGSGGKS